MDKHRNTELKIHDPEHISVIQKPITTSFLECSGLDDILKSHRWLPMFQRNTMLTYNANTWTLTKRIKSKRDIFGNEIF